MNCLWWVEENLSPSSGETLPVENKGGVRSGAVTVTLHCTSWVPELGRVFSQGDEAMPQLIILPAWMLVIWSSVDVFRVSSLYKQCLARPFSGFEQKA